jgi:hypothetical protein
MYGNDLKRAEFSIATLWLNMKLSKKHDCPTPAVNGRRVNLKLSLMQRELSLSLLQQIRGKSPADAVRGCRILNVMMVGFQCPTFKHKLHGLTERRTSFAMSMDKI